MKRFTQLIVSGALLVGMSGCGDTVMKKINDRIKNTVFTDNTTYGITDGNTVDSSNKVTTNIVALEKLTLLVNVEHNRTGDLKMILVNPSGVEVTLVNHKGADHNVTGLIDFSEKADDKPTDANFPGNGSYKPEESFDAFYGTNPGGTWHLKITDDVSNGKMGILNGWILTISGTK